LSIYRDLKQSRQTSAAPTPSTNGHANGHANGAQSPAELVLRPLSEYRARPVRYLVPNTIPIGKVTMVAGVGGMGKSTIMRHLVARLTSGRPAFGMDYPVTGPVDVMLASVEDSPEDTILPHLLSEGADLSRVLIEDGVRKPGWKPEDKTAPFSLHDLDLVMNSFAARPSIRVMVLDPIGSYVARSGANENSSAEVRALLDPLHDLANKTGVAIILIAHLNKANNVAAVNRIIGSSAFRDTCRVVYVMGQDPDDPERRVLAAAKQNVPGLDKRGLAFRLMPLTQDETTAVLAHEGMAGLDDEDRALFATQLSRIAAEGRVDITADQALGTGTKPGAEPSREKKRKKCLDWLLTFLGRYAYPRQELFKAADIAGFSSHQCYRAREDHNNDRPDDEQIWQTKGTVFGGVSWWGIGNYRNWTMRPDPNGDGGQDESNGPDIWPQ
jgi:AAA domain